MTRFFHQLLGRHHHVDPLMAVTRFGARQVKELEAASWGVQEPVIDGEAALELADAAALAEAEPEPALVGEDQHANEPAPVVVQAAPTVAPLPPAPVPQPPAPTPVPEPPAPAPAPARAASAPEAGVIHGIATHYGPSYNGLPLGCGNDVYSPDNPTIVAVGPSRYSQWPCGTQLQVCGPGGCVIVTRQDACPGCSANMVDLSEAANSIVCGGPPHTCNVTIQPSGW